ncbi:FAD-dependent oxidoreductase, partial [Flavobacterium sp. LBUM151]
DGVKVIGYRQAMTLPTQPKSMIIVGSGAIGVEFAHFYNSMGTDVTIVEFMPNIVPVEDEDISKQMERSMKKAGVKIMTNSSVEKIDTTGTGVKATVKTAKGEEILEADIVLSAVGIKTNIENIGLEEVGIVSVVGRSLGRLVGKKIIEKYPDLKEVHGYHMNDFGAIVAAASLAHDIGNPPFGHSGEKAIGEYFSIGNGLKYKDKLTAKQWQDLIDFEGNANGFSVLTASRPGIEGGLRISYATLGAFMKYPKESLPKKPTSNIADKKYGFFQTDKVFFEEVAQDMGMIANKEGEDIGFERHPLAYLVEAAD